MTKVRSETSRATKYRDTELGQEPNRETGPEQSRASKGKPSQGQSQGPSQLSVEGPGPERGFGRAGDWTGAQGWPRTGAQAQGETLTNHLGLGITSLRISLTNRCNEQCLYCRPEDPADGSRRHHGDHASEELTKEEVLGIAGALVEAGATRIRLTGGEPLLRPDLEEILSGLSKLAPRPRLRLTTNGLGLAERAEALADAGLDRVNVSLDSVSAETYARITGRAALDRAMAGIQAALAAGLSPLRTNTVVCAGLNDGELAAICDRAWNLGAVPRFIELMPMGPLGRRPGAFLDAGRILARLERDLGPVRPVGRDRQGGPSQYYETRSGLRFGIIASVTGHICDSCDRGRITAQGGLQTCLAGPVVADLRAEWQRGGAAAVRRAAARAVAEKRPRLEWPLEAAMVNVGG